jgi:hypothetical protein
MRMIARIILAALLVDVGTALADVPRPLPPLTTWYWQLDGTVDQTHTGAAVYDIDMEGATLELITSLKAKNHIVVCYISIGEKENFRSDANQFPANVVGNAVGGYPQEHYVDIRAPIVFTINMNRILTAKGKGCDGIEPDLDDTYTENTGFRLTIDDQFDYNKKIAEFAHRQGMIIALKNGSGINSDGFADRMLPLVDFAIVEQCFQYKECQLWSSFTAAGKAVLAAEYQSFKTNECTQAKAPPLRYSLAFFGSALNGRKYMPC